MIKRLVDIVLFSSFFISVGAGAVVFRTFQVLGFKANWDFIFFACTSTLFTYNLTKVIPIYSERKSENYAYNWRNQWNVEHGKLLLVLTIFPGLISGYYFLKFDFQTQIFIAHIGVISVLYALPIVNGKTLRDLPFLKVILIAYVWAGTSALPLIQNFDLNQIVMVFLETLFFILAITLPFDIRDFARDKSENIKTVPYLVGVNNTKVMSVVFLIFSSIANYFLISESVLNASILLNLIVVIPLILFSSEKRSDYYYLGLIDGVLILRILMF